MPNVEWQLAVSSSAFECRFLLVFAVFACSIKRDEVNRVVELCQWQQHKAAAPNSTKEQGGNRKSYIF